MLLLDTSLLIELEHELARQRVGPARAFLGRHKAEPFACSTVTVGELASGQDPQRVRLFLHRIRKLPVTEAVAYRAAELDRELSRAGRRLGENDNWIAATALLHSATLLFVDGDFERVPRLKRHRLALT